MNISRETLSETKVKLTITLGKEELADGEKVALAKLAKTVKAPGFRKGKVPVSVAAKHVDQQQLAQETLDNALSKAVAEAFTSEDIKALERPQVEMLKFVPGQEAEFTAEAEIIPEIKLADYKKLKAPEQPAVSVKKAEVDEVVDRIKSQLAEKQDVKRAAKDGDEVTIDFVGTKDGEAFDGGSGNDYPLVLGSGSFIPGFEEKIVGHKVGDEFDVDISFPDDYHAKELAGQAVVFKTTIKKIQEVVQPELTDELAAKVGPFTSVKELTDDIKRELKAQAERKAADELRDALVEQLVAASTVPAPQVLLTDQLESIERDLVQNLTQQGVTMDQYLEQKGYKDKDEWIAKEANDVATKRVQAGLVLSELSKAENVTATNEELAARIEEFKKQYANDPETAKRFEEPEIQRDIANRLLTEKTIDHLAELNTKK